MSLVHRSFPRRHGAGTMVRRVPHPPRGLITMALGCALAGALGVAGPSSATAAPPPPGSPLHIAADDVTTEGVGAVRARGHVQVAYGGVLVKSDVLLWNRSVGAAKLIGHVVVIGPQGRVTGDAATLKVAGPDNQVVAAAVTGHAAFESPEYEVTADELAADRKSGRLSAQGHVTIFSAPDIIVTGERGMYDARAQYAVVSGHASVASKDGRLQGAWIELFRPAGRAEVHGPVVADLSGAEITGDQATVTFQTSIAVFAGHVVIARGQDTVWADRATLFYTDRRLVAEGETHARFAGLDEGTP